MNLAQGRNKVFMLIDSYSRSGTVLDQNSPKQKDYTYKIPYLFDTAQKQVATIKKIVKAKKISHNMPVNVLQSPLYQFDIVQYTGTDQIYAAPGTAKAYYFEVDDVATVYIEEQTSTGVWTILKTITNTLTNAGVFTAYKGLITPSVSTNQVRIRFSGTTGYNHRNRALFNFPFSDASRVPDYKKYVLYTMPSDFYQLNKVVLKGQIVNSQPYENTADFYWEQRNIIAINYHNVGEYSIEYFAYPTTIDSTTLDTYEFEVDPEAQEALPFFVASQLLLNENNTAGDRLLAIYNNMLANLDTRITNGANAVQNALFSGNGLNKLF